jgi:site-specific DNA-adenine methylase
VIETPPSNVDADWGLEEAINKTIWGSPAGKKRLADRLAALLPAHKTYVEPFAGSAAVLFAKDPAETEVLNDADPDIAQAYRIIKRLTRKQIERLQRLSWTGDKAMYKRFIDASPIDDVGWLHRFMYLTRFSYGRMRGKGFSLADQGIGGRTAEHIETFAPRLKNVLIYGGDYEKVVRKYDGADTVFYFDPPYAGYNVNIGEDDFDEERFFKVLKSLKGQFLLTYGMRGKLPGLVKEAGFTVKRIRPSRVIGSSMHGVGVKALTTLLVSNYNLVEKNLAEALGDDWEQNGIFEAAEYIETTKQTGVFTKSGLLVFELSMDTLNSEGKAQLLFNSKDFIKVRFFGERLKGVFVLTRNADEWLWQPSQEAPELEEKSKSYDFEIYVPINYVEIRKATNGQEKRLATGIVLEPDAVDAQKDFEEPETIEKAAHNFLASYNKPLGQDGTQLGLMHRQFGNLGIELVESYISPSDFQLGNGKVKKGSWIMTVHITSDKVWEDIKAGKLTGFSIGGVATVASHSE